MSKKEEAKRLLAPGSVVYLVTSQNDNSPNVRAMAIVKCEELKTVWMLTSKCCDKYRELSRNPQCLLYATDPTDNASYLELRLWGNMELLDDAASRALAWREDYLCYFPGGRDDPNLCVLKFTTASAALQTQAGKDKFTL